MWAEEANGADGLVVEEGQHVDHAGLPVVLVAVAAGEQLLLLDEDLVAYPEVDVELLGRGDGPADDPQAAGSAKVGHTRRPLTSEGPRE
jgi:hypothetical protein